jgi:hypothetical protein
MTRTAPQNATPTRAALQNAAETDAIVAALKSAIFDAFALTHIAEAQVEYDTEGDDGELQIHPVTCIDENGQPVACPEFTLSEPLAFVPGGVPEPGRRLADAIPALVHLLLNQEPCLWVGEDGVFGTILFLAANRAIRLEHTRRFLSYETASRSL